MSEFASDDSCGTSTISFDTPSTPPSSVRSEIVFDAPTSVIPLDDASRCSAHIRIPACLPPKPSGLEVVKMSSLSLQEGFDLPEGFLAAKLKELGPTLLNVCTSTRVQMPPQGTALPAHLFTTRTLSPPGPRATHILAISSPSSSGHQHLYPIHGLVWATQCTTLSSLSTSNPPSTSQDAYLPVVPLLLPSLHAFPTLQGWIYLRSPYLLLHWLLVPSLPSPHPVPNHSLLPIDSVPFDLSSQSQASLLVQAGKIFELWKDVVALGIGEEVLWEVLRSAWRRIVEALVVESQKSHGTSVKAHVVV